MNKHKTEKDLEAMKGLSTHFAIAGSLAAYGTGMLLIVYAGTTAMGLLSLKSPQDPIGDPFFSLMEILILLTAPLMMISMIAVHGYASKELKLYSLAALLCMALMTGITSCVHFVVLTVSRQIESAGFQGASWIFSFTWPSVIYTLDILAWDWFFALSMIFGAFIFRASRLERAIRITMLTSGLLSLAGLIGVILENMQIRNIGIIGYAVVSIAVFFLLGTLFKRGGSGGSQTQI